MNEIVPTPAEQWQVTIQVGNDKVVEQLSATLPKQGFLYAMGALYDYMQRRLADSQPEPAFGVIGEFLGKRDKPEVVVPLEKIMGALKQDKLG